MLHLRALELNDAPVTLHVVARRLAQWPMFGTTESFAAVQARHIGRPL